MLTKADWEDLDGDPDIRFAALSGESLGLDPRLRVVAIRRFVHDPKAPPQGKKIAYDPNWRYQVLVTSLRWKPVDVWRFYNDHGDCERIFKVGKHGLGMGWLIGHKFRANAVAFLLRMLAYNVDLLFQRRCERRARKQQRSGMRLGLQARQHHFYRGSGRLLREHNRWVLRVSPNPEVKRLWAYYAPELLAGT